MPYDVEKSRKVLEMVRRALSLRAKNPELASYKPDPSVRQHITDTLSDAGGKVTRKEDFEKSLTGFLAKAKEYNSMMEKASSDDERMNYRKQRDSSVIEGLKTLKSLIPQKLEKAQYAKTAPVEERKGQRRLKQQEERNKKVIASKIKQDAIEVVSKMPGHEPGKGIASENPKKTLREPNKVNAGEAVNPRKDK